MCPGLMYEIYCLYEIGLVVPTADQTKGCLSSESFTVPSHSTAADQNLTTYMSQVIVAPE